MMVFVMMSDVLETQPRETNQKNGSTSRVKTTKDSIMGFVVRHSWSDNGNNSDNKEGINSQVEKFSDYWFVFRGRFFVRRERSSHFIMFLFFFNKT